ncbi:reverse transcriptase, partial [Rhizoctonia solani 123E]
MQVIKETKNNKAPGEDGLSYEFYKHWLKQWEDNEKENKIKIPDISKILYEVYKDIETTGEAHFSFTIGRMYLLYKKGSKTKIENYRPLTLLNTDYKILTKVIAAKLGEVAGKILHENQAGFVPKRSIYDQVRLNQMIINYAEIKEEDGLMVSLDQEKAYDKIDHDYLWEVLTAFGFPKEFIKTIKALYNEAQTRVIVNNSYDVPFSVNRGVRQGDPMSCILYDLAIEPLANSIRKCEKITGYKVKGMKEPLKVTLFADDTVVFLKKNNKVKNLEIIINKFCKASTAKFNLGKTNYLPIGT